MCSQPASHSEAFNYNRIYIMWTFLIFHIDGEISYHSLLFYTLNQIINVSTSFNEILMFDIFLFFFK